MLPARSERSLNDAEHSSYEAERSLKDAECSHLQALTLHYDHVCISHTCS
jgi:hypothetical protein